MSLLCSSTHISYKNSPSILSNKATQTLLTTWKRTFNFWFATDWRKKIALTYSFPWPLRISKKTGEEKMPTTSTKRGKYLALKQSIPHFPRIYHVHSSVVNLTIKSQPRAVNTFKRNIFSAELFSIFFILSAIASNIYPLKIPQGNRT